MKEKPVPMIVRFYKKQMSIIKKVAKKRNMSRASFIRDAVEAYETNYPV